MPEPLVVAGAGMAGLCAAVRATQLGARPLVLERGVSPGGSLRLSSGDVWRHREWEDFRRECPGGDPALQRLLWERLDDALLWLRSLGAPVVASETGNPLTTGVRFEPAGLVEAILTRLPEDAPRLESALPAEPGERTVLATGGFAASPELVTRFVHPAAPLRLRGNPWSTGGGLEHATARGAALTTGLDEFYGRNMPDAPWGEAALVPAAQLYARHARIFDEDGVEFFHAADVAWSETDVVQATAHRPGARAYYLLDQAGLGARVRERSVREVVAAAGPARVPVEALPFAAPAGTVAAVRVAAAITHTIGGLRIDEQARLLDEADEPLPGLWAAGVDAGGIATGGYASGLAQALVLGLVAAESALA